jgi:hypothetical protein
MTRYLSIKDFETALRAIDPTVEVFSFNSEAQVLAMLENPPAGKQIARGEGGENNLLLIFNATGPAGLSGLVLTSEVKGGHFAIEAGVYEIPVLGTPVEVRVHFSPAVLQAYLITKQADNTVVVYADESAVNSVGAYRVITQPGRYVAIKGTQPATMLFIRNYEGVFLTVFK